MDNRLNTLFYTIMVIFAATAIVTLLGVVKAVPIEQESLRLLVAAFLLELAGAVVALVRGAPFFTAKADTVTSLAHSIGVIDELTPQIEAVATGATQAAIHRQYGIVVRKEVNDLVAYQRLQVISGDDLRKLPPEQQATIQAFESSMYRFEDKWKKLYDKRSKASSDEARRETEAQIASLVRAMKKDLLGVLDYLIQQGMVLTDHYMSIRGHVDSIAANINSD